MKTNTLEMKVGLFAAAAILVIAVFTFSVSDRHFSSGGSYKIHVVIDSAEGLSRKTPVEVAGIRVGAVDDLYLTKDGKAHATLKIERVVQLGLDAKAQVRTKGFLGETYVDLIPGNTVSGLIHEGGEVKATNPYVDLGQIAADVKEVTTSIKKMMADDGEGPVSRILKNMETFTQKLSEISVANQESVNQIVANLKDFSASLNDVMQDRRQGLKDTMERLDRMTRNVEEGKGTVGRLLRDDDIAENINEAAKGLKETVGGVNRFQIEMGYHLEYLAGTRNFKNYVELAFKPRPDKFFLVEFVLDRFPAPIETVTDTTITSGGTTTTVRRQDDVQERDKFLISVELAKTFYNFTVRGGIIESSGGLGLDYVIGPLAFQFSAFSLRTDSGQRPHVKAWGTVNLTPNFYLVSGADDFISKQQKLDWFVGAGLKFVDNDLKSLLGAAKLR